MKDRLKISLVTPSFNQGQFIEETICSVLDQGYPNLEYIIVDGGSHDETVDIVRKYHKHLKFWVSEPDDGQSDAINKGLQHCTGKVFNWLNSDDILLPNTLNLIDDNFRSSDFHLVSGQEVHFDDKNEWLKYGTKIYSSLEHSIYSAVFYQPSTFWRIDIFRELMPINTNLHFLMDTDLWVRYQLKYGTAHFKKLKEPLVKFRFHTESKSASQKAGFDKERINLRSSLALSFGNMSSHDSKILELDSVKYMYRSDLQLDARKIRGMHISAFFTQKFMQGLLQDMIRLIVTYPRIICSNYRHLTSTIILLFRSIFQKR